jgi:hypothetical protein
LLSIPLVPIMPSWKDDKLRIKLPHHTAVVGRLVFSFNTL